MFIKIRLCETKRCSSRRNGERNKRSKNKWADYMVRSQKSGQSVSSGWFCESLNKWLSWQWEAYEMFWESLFLLENGGVYWYIRNKRAGSIKYVANIDKGIEWSVANRENQVKLTDFINRFNNSIKDWTLSTEDIVHKEDYWTGRDYANFGRSSNTITENNKFWRSG